MKREKSGKALLSIGTFIILKACKICYNDEKLKGQDYRDKKLGGDKILKESIRY